jgi:hypothetical protein
MKNIFLFALFILLSILSTSIYCQKSKCITNINQFTNGKYQITFYITDCETNEPLIGAIIYSFNKDEILGTSDLDGIVITIKGLSGNLEISYVGYYPACFKLINDSIDSIKVELKTDLNIGCDFLPQDDSTKRTTDSLIHKSESDARLDISHGDIYLFTKVPPTNEQILFAENYSFSFIIWNELYYYREIYNKVVLDYLSEKFNLNIEEELRRICWRNHQL